MKIFILSLLFLVGCTADPIIESKTVEVKIPIPVPCKIKPVERPQSPLDSLKKEDDLHTKAKAILAQIELDRGYQTELEAAIKECQ